MLHRQPKRTNKRKMKGKPRRGAAKGGIDRNSTLVKTYGVVRQNKLNFLPPWLESPMRYADKFNLTILGGGVADYIFRANSLFDPDRTSVGHQPLGFDTLASVYNRYRVDRIEWYIELPSSTVTYSATVVLINGAATLTSNSVAEEFPTARFRSIGFNGAPPAIFTGHKSLPAYNGKSVIAYNTDDTTGSLVTTNPVETIDLHLFIENPNITSIVVQVNVSLKYRAVFYDPITPGQSFDKKIQKPEVTFTREELFKLEAKISDSGFTPKDLKILGREYKRSNSNSSLEDRLVQCGFTSDQVDRLQGLVKEMKL